MDTKGSRTRFGGGVVRISPPNGGAAAPRTILRLALNAEGAEVFAEASRVADVFGATIGVQPNPA